MTHAGVLCLCSLIKAYRRVPPSFPHSFPPSLTPSLTRPYLSSTLHSAFLPIFTSRPTSRFFLFPPSISLLILPAVLHPHPTPLLCTCRPKVTSTGRPSMRTRCWRLRGAGSWSSSSLSSLSPRASSHLKVSATYEVGHQARSQGLISSLSYPCE